MLLGGPVWKNQGKDGKGKVGMEVRSGPKWVPWFRC